MQVRFEPTDGAYLLTTGFDNLCRCVARFLAA